MFGEIRVEWSWLFWRRVELVAVEANIRVDIAVEVEVRVEWKLLWRGLRKEKATRGEKTTGVKGKGPKHSNVYISNEEVKCVFCLFCFTAPHSTLRSSCPILERGKKVEYVGSIPPSHFIPRHMASCLACLSQRPLMKEVICLKEAVTCMHLREGCYTGFLYEPLTDC